MSISIAAAFTTIALKLVAWRLTGSVGLLSDALESFVNLLAAVIALVMVRWATLPADKEHTFGHEKAEYFSAGAEGVFILVAAAAIAFVAVERLLHPQPLQAVGIGLAVSAGASLVNLGVAVMLIRAGHRHRSITVEADGRHLMTDVLTSAGVIAGVGAVALTGWRPLDPIIAIAVACNIVITGVKLVRRAGGGLMDRALAADEQAAIELALAPYREQGIGFHALQTRQSGSRSFVSLHVLVPGSWSVRKGHELLERLEHDVATALPSAAVTTHLEPLANPPGRDRGKRSAGAS